MPPACRSLISCNVTAAAAPVSFTGATRRRPDLALAPMPVYRRAATTSAENPADAGRYQAGGGAG